MRCSQKSFISMLHLLSCHNLLVVCGPSKLSEGYECLRSTKHRGHATNHYRGLVASFRAARDAAPVAARFAAVPWPVPNLLRGKYPAEDTLIAAVRPLY